MRARYTAVTSLLAAMALSQAPVHAQFFFPIPITLPVTDAATIGKNVLTVSQRQLALDREQKNNDLIRRMGRSLDLSTLR